MGVEYVYFIYDKHTKRTKIGKSTNVKDRLSALQICNPELVLVYVTDKHNEKYYHDMFKDKRVTREWFNIRVDDYKKIISKGTKLPRALYYSKKHQIRIIKEVEIHSGTMKQIYRFTNVPGLYADMEGNFHHPDKPVKKVCNNGSLAVQVGSSKFGIKKLRKTAYKDLMDDYVYPF